jgi:hypothetical protein
MTTEEVAERFSTNPQNARNWAAKNGVIRVPVPGTGIMGYDWTEVDCQQFAERRGRGWTKGRPRKQA